MNQKQLTQNKKTSQNLSNWYYYFGHETPIRIVFCNSTNTNDQIAELIKAIPDGNGITLLTLKLLQNFNGNLCSCYLINFNTNEQVMLPDCDTGKLFKSETPNTQFDGNITPEGEWFKWTARYTGAVDQIITVSVV